MTTLLEKFAKFLNIFWQDNDPETALLIWNHQLQSNPDTAEDYLRCLDQLIANPPDNLTTMIQEEGWLYLYHEDSDIAYTTEEYLAWLQEMVSEFQDSYNNFISSPAYSLRLLMREFFLNCSRSQTLAKWQEFVGSSPEQARSLLDGARRLVQEAPEELQDIVQTYGRIFLFHNESQAYTLEEQVMWLEERLSDLEKIYADKV